jgi:hypothetical protein
MTLALLCGSLEAGADGVGDYSRRLAAACTELGVTTSVVALHDRHVSSPRLEQQSADGCCINTLRLPVSLSWRHRSRLLAEQLRQWECSAISLQFVPYAFDRRGLPLGLLTLLGHLEIVPDLRVHLMFHEIWIGISSSSDRRSRLIGHLQRRLVQAIHTTLCPAAVHVTNSTYACCLRRAGMEAVRLPLFSTLELPPTPPPVGPASTFSACVFGRIPPPWDPDPALEVVVAEAARRQQAPRLLLVGRPWIDDPWFERLQQRWPQLQIVRHGIEPDSHKLCELIRSCQLGLATVPWGLIEKSSAVSVFLSLDLPVLVSRNGWSLSRRWRGQDDPDLPDHSNLYRLSSLQQGLDPARLPRYQPSTPHHVASVIRAALWPAPADPASLHG